MEKDKATEWRRMKAQVEKDEGPEAEALSILLMLLKAQTILKAQVKYVFSYNFYLL